MFRARFRFRVERKLNIDAAERRFEVAGKEVVLKSAIPDTKIKDSGWLVMNARGFMSEAEARTFGNALKAGSEISSITTRLGIDSGVDIATSAISEALRQSFREKAGLLVRNNIHGVDVFPDDPNVTFFSLQATASALIEPEPFLGDIAQHVSAAEKLSKSTQDIVLLLNYALMRTDPVAQIVFAVSAVEMLGQQEKWTEDQKRLIEQLSKEAEGIEIGTPEERREVAEAITRSPKIGLRQGVVRLLSKHGLDHLTGEWTKLYRERSTLVHGLAPKPGIDYSPLAQETVNLCGQILLTVISKEITSADHRIQQFYPTR